MSRPITLVVSRVNDDDTVEDGILLFLPDSSRIESVAVPPDPGPVEITLRTGEIYELSTLNTTDSLMDLYEAGCISWGGVRRILTSDLTPAFELDSSAFPQDLGTGYQDLREVLRQHYNGPGLDDYVVLEELDSDNSGDSTPNNPKED